MSMITTITTMTTMTNDDEKSNDARFVDHVNDDDDDNDDEKSDDARGGCPDPDTQSIRTTCALTDAICCIYNDDDQCDVQM